jgi:hypothetical protein
MIIQRRFAPTGGHFEPESVACLTGISTLVIASLYDVTLALIIIFSRF